MAPTLLQRYELLVRSIRQAMTALGRDPGSVRLVAVSKGAGADTVATLSDAGQTLFGESRVQEFLQKRAALPDLSLEWHFIGTLQRNKAQHVVGASALIHSVDSFDLAKRISSLAKGRTQPVLLQVNVSGEASKRGFLPHEWERHLEALAGLPGLALQGLMTLAPKEATHEEARACFATLRELARAWSARAGLTLSELSMGMSRDWNAALQEGATLLRIGRELFGKGEL